MALATIDRSAMRVARAAARDLMREGARAVVLTGSHARGEAHAESDIDLLAVGAGSRHMLLRRGDFLVAVTRKTLAGFRGEFDAPADVGWAVPGWREAIVLADPERLAARLQSRARTWTWAAVEAESDAWVAGAITGLAEEVHKLVGALKVHRTSTAAVQRSVLSLQLAGALAVHLRILYGSENVLWDLVCERMGGAWADVQARAFGQHGERFDETCAAALELYRLAATEADRTLNGRQRAVVAHACRLASTIT